MIKVKPSKLWSLTNKLYIYIYTYIYIYAYRCSLYTEPLKENARPGVTNTFEGLQNLQ